MPVEPHDDAIDPGRGGEMRVGSVVIDCNDFDAMFAFWREALRYVPREDPEEDWHPRTPEPGEDFISLLDPEGNVFDVIDTRRDTDGGEDRPG